MQKCNIVIVGGGTAGWITASILIKGLDTDQFSVTLIESPDIPTVGVGEATIPPITQLAQFLAINPAELLHHIKGTFKYGIHFENWSNLDESYMHAFGYLVPHFNGIPLSQMWLQYKEVLKLPPLNYFMPSAVAAYNKRFTLTEPRPKNARPEHFYPLSELHHAYHFDASLLASYLTTYATTRGVKLVNATVCQVNQHANGDIKSLTLTDKENITGDIFVDCSGARGLINKQTLKTPFKSWKNYLPCDTALTVQTGSDSSPLPYTQSIAMNSGWRWKIPLIHRQGNGYVHASEFISKQAAINEFEQALALERQLTDIRTIPFETGMLSKPWHNNSVAIGLASGFLEPLESTSIHLVHKYALELMNALRYGEQRAIEAKNFNEKFNRDMTHIRDFLVLHYHVNQRNDSPFWQYCQQLPLPDSLSHYLDEYKKTGFIHLPQDSLFTFDSWLQVLTGQRYLKNYHHLAKHDFPLESVLNYFKLIRRSVENAVTKMPTHKSYLNSLAQDNPVTLA